MLKISWKNLQVSIMSNIPHINVTVPGTLLLTTTAAVVWEGKEFLFSVGMWRLHQVLTVITLYCHWYQWNTWKGDLRCLASDGIHQRAIFGDIECINALSWWYFSFNIQQLLYMITTHCVWELALTNPRFSTRRAPIPKGKGANLLFSHLFPKNCYLNCYFSRFFIQSK